METEATVIRTERGLTIAGTRITLYSIMDYIKAGWPTQLIQDRLNLTEQQIVDVMHYIKTHEETIEAEYQLVLEEAEANRRYWEEKNRELFSTISTLSPPADNLKAWQKLQSKKQELNMT